ncbi:MAG: type 4a pilus biogenesis protein PilO [Actinomycetota bacterium]|nr:type 4a pilus biogenesis protein PilO [Actinomycetota bacterium]
MIAIVVVGLLLVALLGHIALVGRQNGKADELARKADAAEARVQAIYRAKAAAVNTTPVRSADLFRLTKAMPSTARIPDVVLELNSLAARTGIHFESIAPQTSSVVGSYRVVPINLVFNGTFADLSRFVSRLRGLVRVRGGRLQATGRLYSIDTLTFETSQEQPRRIEATLTVDAYVYERPAAARTGTPPPVTPTTPASESSSATATGATP